VTRPRPESFPERWTQLPLPLPRLLDDEDVNVAGRWSFAIVTIGHSGRVTLPAEARALIDGGEVALLRDGGGGRAVAVDGQFRSPPAGMAEATDLGVTIDDLIAAAATLEDHSVPMTVAEFVASIAPTFSPNTAATYATYWRLAVARFGDRRIGEITVDDCATVVADAESRARGRRDSSDGRSSRENCVAALRALFTCAQSAGRIGINPAAAIPKPRRRPSRRRPLDHPEIEGLVNAIRTTSNDPDLDLLLIRFHLESGARREGALNLRIRDLDDRRATAWLRVKFGAEREQPISPSLLRLVARHANVRGAGGPDDAVFRTRNGTPITRRRFNTIFDRARPCLGWADRTLVSAHVLRYTAINAVGRVAGYAVAQAFAGHAPPSVTGLHLRARPCDVVAAVASSPTNLTRLRTAPTTEAMWTC
jgi:integrase/recombinase XerC